MEVVNGASAFNQRINPIAGTVGPAAKSYAKLLRQAFHNVWLPVRNDGIAVQDISLVNGELTFGSYIKINVGNQYINGKLLVWRPLKQASKKPGKKETTSPSFPLPAKSPKKSSKKTPSSSCGTTRQ